MDFTTQIICWYKANKRNLPWRETQDPYRIWLSEIILQQTRIEQGKKYYLAFIKRYPTVHKLANAPNDKIMKLWQGLGYYSRARNLHQTAKQIVKEYKGIFPEDFVKLKELKGIGEYTAAAIASFAFNKPFAVVDGNVIRVISRIFGITKPVDKPGVIKEIRKIANELLSLKEPGLFNQAMMEFGAIQCRPQNPLCSQCPVNATCYAFSKKIMDKLPVKTKKLPPKNRYLNYLIINSIVNKQPCIYIKKRTGNDIWKNLYDFPCIETIALEEPEVLISLEEWKDLFKNKRPVITSVSELFKHQLTHQTIYARFYEISLKSLLHDHPKKLKLILKEDLKQYAIPRLIEKYLQLKSPG